MSRIAATPVLALALLAAVGLAPLAQADPCGMVPPITVDDPTPIARVGDQQTYVFFKDGLETFVIRPGFRGKTEEFGMLIPFPTPPAIRKVPDDIFPQITAAIDPPEVVVDLRIRLLLNQSRSRTFDNKNGRRNGLGVEKNADRVTVLREEAVGMYEVAVLDAGSAKALRRWMTDHKYKYPDGMDSVCDDYVGQGWCFVAVKTRVSGKSGVDPQPGIREVKPGLPSGSTFDGHVQAMGFRFKTEKLVVPMRLSAFNEGELRNIVYLVTDGPRKIRSIPEEYVVRQVTGQELHRNVTGPLPLRIIGGTEADIPKNELPSLAIRRNPEPHNGNARDLLASDVLAVNQGRLSHPFEEDEKMLLRIGEHFALRGPAIDAQNATALATARKVATKDAVGGLKDVTLTVIDGDFPREVLGSKNLTFAEYQMPARRNSAAMYDANTKEPSPPREGVLKLGHLDPREGGLSPRLSALSLGIFGVMLLALGLVVFRHRD